MTVLRISRWYNAFIRSRVAEVLHLQELSEYSEREEDSVIS